MVAVHLLHEHDLLWEGACSRSGAQRQQVGLGLTPDVSPAATYLEKPQVSKGLCSWLGPDFVRVPSLRRRSVGTRQTDIPVLVALSRHPCRSTHSASPALGLHRSRDWRCLFGRVPRSEATATATATATAMAMAGDGVYPAGLLRDVWVPHIFCMSTILCGGELAGDLARSGSRFCVWLVCA